MRVFYTILLIFTFFILLPVLNAKGLEYTKDDVGINATALLEKNRDHLYPTSIQYLDKRTPVKLEYNDEVKIYIDDYVLGNPQMLSTIIGRSDYYFPIFDNILAKHNLPLELKNLSFVESLLDPFAVSKSGATGLWQFLFHTSKMFHLDINSYIDERRDPVQSTEAASEFLSYLYHIFNDWQLAITAYNCGPGMVENAIERSGGSTNYWEIRDYLPTEAKNYYPKFVAACYLTSFYKNHDIKPKRFDYQFDEVEKVQIKQSVWYKQITSIIDINTKDIRLLNPVFKQDYVPVYDDDVSLILPIKAVKAFNENEDKIYANIPEVKDYHDLLLEAGNTNGKVLVNYVVSKGEYFHRIAMIHGCTIYDIMKWNNLPTKHLQSGQKLMIYIDEAVYNKNVVRLKNNLPVEKENLLVELP